MSINELFLMIDASLILIVPWWDLISQPIVFLYLGPETTLPLASALAAFIGLLLVFGRYVIVVARKVFRFSVRKVSSLFGQQDTSSDGGSGNDGDTQSRGVCG